MRKISIITPCFNAERYIQETINSVISQTAILSGRLELEYIICDGNSTDGTLEIIQDLNFHGITLISEKDNGMYDALSKGLKRVSGDIVAYINAGDYYHKCAFDIVLDILDKKDVNWLTGYTTLYNEKSYVFPKNLPYKYRKRFFDCGFYMNKLPVVQQESTFWASFLNNYIDFEYLSNLKMAGDFYLWQQFSKKEELKIVDAYLGGFRRQKGQLSENIDAYHKEVFKMVVHPSIYDLFLATFDKTIFYLAPNKLKKIMNNDGIFIFNHDLQEWV
ncbi:MAG: glycosyltransferase [Nostoc sp.]